MDGSGDALAWTQRVTDLPTLAVLENTGGGAGNLLVWIHRITEW